MPRIVAVCLSPDHSFSKSPCASIQLLAGLGVEGDAHCGATVKHRSRVAKNPTQPNLRQVHLVHEELFQELACRGFSLVPGAIGENITTRGLDLLGLPLNTLLHIGTSAIVRVTGLRNPCVQLDRHHSGLMSAVLDRMPDGKLIRKAGIMSVVEYSGPVAAGDQIIVQLPPTPHRPLERV